MSSSFTVSRGALPHFEFENTSLQATAVLGQVSKLFPNFKFSNLPYDNPFYQDPFIEGSLKNLRVKLSSSINDTHPLHSLVSYKADSL